MQITKEIKNKIKKLKPKSGIVSFVLVDKKKKEEEFGKICRCGHITIGREYRSTSMEVSKGFREYYLLCMECDETEYCSTISNPDNNAESYVRTDRGANKEVFITIN